MTVSKGLRTLFCNILVNCDPANPQAILDQFAEDMSVDFLYKRRKLDCLSTDDELHVLARNDLLIALSNTLMPKGQSL